MRKRIAALLSITFTLPTIVFTASPGLAAVPAVDQLEKALLAPAQAPAGFVFHSRTVLAASVVPEAVADPCKEATPKFVDSPGGSVTITFQKGGRDGTVIMEALNAIGATAATDQVKRHQTVLDRCPTATKEITYTKWQAPDVGVPAVGFLVTVARPKEEVEKMITVAVAHGDVLATFTAEATDGAALTAAVTAGVAKLKQTV